MSLGFWEKLRAKKKPIIVLAPMADVTDAAFRRIIAKYSKYGGKFTRPSFAKQKLGGPDVMWTEFVSADGLMSPGREHLLIDLMYTKKERPIVAQIFSAHPEKVEGAAKLCAELGFDGIDINMGCPDRSVMKQGAGGALIKNPKLAVEIIKAAQRGVEAVKKKGKDAIPVSVKTRIGYSKNELDAWLPALLSAEPAVVTIHARTVKELSLVPARWEHVKEAVEVRNNLKSKTLIFGNGDVTSLKDAKRLAKETGADGVMIGRGIFGNPWFFDAKRKKQPEPKEKMRVLLEHVRLFEKLLGKRKNFAIMKKHFKAYVNGFDGAKEIRAQLMETNNAKEFTQAIKPYL